MPTGKPNTKKAFNKVRGISRLVAVDGLMPPTSDILVMGKQTILGIDPGLADTGYGIIAKEKNQLKLIDYGSIRTRKGLELPNRLEQIAKELNKIIKKHQPDCVAVEELFFCKNIKTALLVGQARGVVLLTMEKNKLPIFEFTPLQVKQAVTSYGQADKRQVQEMVKIILNLDKIPKPDDAADALAIAICAAHTKNKF